MARNFITGIDIGSSTVRIVVCEYSDREGILALRALVRRPSRGLRHGYITNIDEVSRAIREALAECERVSRTRIKRATVAVGGTSIAATHSSGAVVIGRADGEVTDLDIRRTILASETPILEKSNVRIVHTIPLEWKLDGKKILGKPSGMQGSRLEVKTLFITCHKTHFDQLVKATEGAGIEVDDCVAAPIAEGMVVLSPLQKSVGAVVANIGSETVSVATFEEGLPISMQVFPLGSSDITNDIALGFKVPLEEAELMKTGGVFEQKQTRKKMDDIIEARLRDVFELIENHLKKIGRNALLPAGIVITGAGARLPIVEALAKRYLNLPARVGENIHLPENVRFPEFKQETQSEGNERQKERSREKYSQIREPEWSVAYGLCIVGLSMEDGGSLGWRFAKGISQRVREWLKQFLP